MQVRDVMTREVVTLNREDEFGRAGDIMRVGRIRHLPVVESEGGALVGVLSQRDLLRAALLRCADATRCSELKTVAVRDVMTPAPATTTPDAPLKAAATLMLQRKIGCLPVLETGKLVGILTESDFVVLVARGRGARLTPRRAGE